MLIETFEDFINRLDFNSIIQDPSKFLFEEFNIELSNVELIVIFAIVILFIAELAIRNKNKINQELSDQEKPLKKPEKNNEISSDAIRQKIDLAIALMNMEKKNKAINLLKKLEKYQLTKKQLKQINELREKVS